MSVVYKQIPNMPLAIALAGPEEFEIVQAGTSKRTSIDKVTSLVITQVAGSPAPPTGPAGGDLAGFYPNPQLKPSGTNGQVMTTVGGVSVWATPAPSGGSVTNVSVVSVNGLAGTVVTPTTTPQISLSTTVTGMLKGNGTAILAAIAGTDFVTPGGLPTTLPPSGAAGGDLSGTYPNPLLKPSVTNGQIMTTVGGVSVWAAAPASATLPAGSVGYGAVGNTLTGVVANLSFDATNKRLGINQATPTAALDIVGQANTLAFNATGYSLTGSSAVGCFNITGALNTTGTPDIFAINVTDTSNSGGNAFIIRGGPSGTASLIRTSMAGDTRVAGWVQARLNDALATNGRDYFAYYLGNGSGGNIGLFAGLSNPTFSTFGRYGSIYLDGASPGLPYYNNNGTTGWDRLVGETSTQTLTNKSLTSPTITGTPAIAGYLALAGGTMTGTITSTLGSIAVNTPMITGTQTWNAGAVAFEGIKLNVINTASSISSFLMRLQISSADRFSVDRTGAVASGNITAGGTVQATGAISALTGTAVPAGGTAGAGYLFSSTTNFGTIFGSGAPTASAARGSIYLRSDGSPYVNLNGTTTWGQLALLTDVPAVAGVYLPLAGGTMTGTITSTQGTTAANRPFFDGTETWNNAAVNFTGIKLNIINTASLDPSYPLQIQVSSSNIFSVDKYGNIVGNSGIYNGDLVQSYGRHQANSNTAIPAAGTAGNGHLFSTTANFGTNFGSGLPTVAMARGSLYLRSDGLPYVNRDGATNWGALTALSVGTTAPTAPNDGELWFYSDASSGGGTLYIRYNDGSSTAWVPASPAATPGLPLVPRVQVFNASGTYTPNANMVSGYVVGKGGGGAAGAFSGLAGVSHGAGGGAEGNTVTTYFVRSQVVPTVAVQVGAGGTPVTGSTGNTGGSTTFGALLTATGGTGGSQYSGGIPNSAGNVGSVIQYGCPGGSAMMVGATTNTTGNGGAGGGSGGGPGAAVGLNVASAGTNGAANSGGGGGGTANNNLTGAMGAAYGGSGYLYVVEYCTS